MTHVLRLDRSVEKLILVSERWPMVIIAFPDKDTEKRAIGFLLGRFPGKFFKTGDHIVPEAAAEALAQENFAFTVKGKATYEQQVAAFRGAATSSVQRRPRRAGRPAR
jgi:hypothetical protein